MMGELQATIEFSVELHKFYNVDLFQRGFYQIRLVLKSNSKFSPKVEVSLPKNAVHGFVFPACIVNGSVVSKTFQILYRNEEVLLDDVALFRIHMLVDGQKIADCIKKAEFQLLAELWFTDTDYGPEHHNSIQCVNTRTLNIHFNPYKGIHYHLPVLFDYFHLCAVTLTVHGTLVSLHQPYIRRSSTGIISNSNGSKLSAQRYRSSYSNGGSSSTLESVLFSSSSSSSFGTRLTVSPSSPRFTQARTIHREICSLLLSSYESLQKKLLSFMKLLPPRQRLHIESSDCFSRLNILSKSANETDEEDELVAIATSDIAQLCAENVIFWQQFLEVVTFQHKIRHSLSREHHIKRVKRFAEAYFIVENARHALLACNDASIQKYTQVSESLRSSKYFNSIPPLEIECASIDGDPHTLPVIFEDHYQEISSRSLSHPAPYTCPVSFGDIKPSLHADNDDSSIHSADSYTDSIKLSRKNSLKDKFKNTLKKSSSGSISSESSTGKPYTKNDSMKAKIKLGSKTSKLFRKRTNKMDTSKSVESNDQVILTGFKKMESSKSVPQHLTSQNSTEHVDENAKKPNEKNDKIFHESRRKADTEVFKHCSLLITDSSAISMPDICQGSNKNKDIKELFKKELGKVIKLKRSRSMPELNIQCSNLPAEKLKDTKKKQRRKRLHSTPVFPVVESFPVITNNPLPITNSSIRISGSHVKITRPESKIESYIIHHKVPDPLKKVVKDAILSDQDVGVSKTNSSVSSNSPSSDNKSFEKSQKRLQKQRALQSSVDSNENENVCEASSVTVTTKLKHQGSNEERRKNSKHERLDSLEKAIRQISEDSDANDVFDSLPAATNQNASGGKVGKADNKKSTKKDMEMDKANVYEEIPPLPPKEFRDPLPDIKTDPPDDSLNQGSISHSFYNSLPPPLPKRHSCIETSSSKHHNKYKNQLQVQSHYRSHSITITSQDNQTQSTKTVDDFDESSRTLVKPIKVQTVDFIKAKEQFKLQISPNWLLYSDFSMLASTIPYYQFDGEFKTLSAEGVHLVVCVHGLDGNSADLRLVRTYLELGLPGTNFEFLMSERNQGDTFADFETMTDRLVTEIIQHIKMYTLNPSKISFIGHSLGNIIIRSALAKSEMKPYLSKLCSFLSLSGPHLGTLYNTSGLVNMGMWFMQKWKKSGSLLQLAMKDAVDIRQSFLYRLSQKSGLEFFKNILLFGSSQDRYVPVHSARIEMCKSALKDNSVQGAVYREMVTNLLRPLLSKPEVTLIRYDVHHALQNNTANTLIGRAAHIAVLDSELFIEKFMVVCGLKYFS